MITLGLVLRHSFENRSMQCGEHEISVIPHQKKMSALTGETEATELGGDQTLWCKDKTLRILTWHWKGGEGEEQSREEGEMAGLGIC